MDFLLTFLSWHSGPISFLNLKSLRAKTWRLKICSKTPRNIVSVPSDTNKDEVRTQLNCKALQDGIRIIKVAKIKKFATLHFFLTKGIIESRV